MKTKIHREWFQPLVKTTCPCGCKKTQVFAWGEYHKAKWRTIDHFCQACFSVVLTRLMDHAKGCGCQFELVARSGYSLPVWLKLPDTACAA